MGIFDWLFGGRRTAKPALDSGSDSVQALRRSVITPYSSPQSASRAGTGDTGRFGTDRHKPVGAWVQTTMTVSVTGIQHRKSAVGAFCRAVRQATKNQARYGVRLRPEPGNQHDPNAIAVDGFAGSGSWHIGYLSRDLAKEIRDDLLDKGVPIDAELYNIWVGDNDFTEINVIVLAPPGHGMKARVKGRV